MVARTSTTSRQEKPQGGSEQGGQVLRSRAPNSDADFSMVLLRTGFLYGALSSSLSLPSQGFLPGTSSFLCVFPYVYSFVPGKEGTAVGSIKLLLDQEDVDIWRCPRTGWCCSVDNILRSSPSYPEHPKITKKAKITKKGKKGKSMKILNLGLFGLFWPFLDALGSMI